MGVTGTGKCIEPRALVFPPSMLQEGSIAHCVDGILLGEQAYTCINGDRCWDTENRPPIIARWSTGPQALYPPLILGCFPGPDPRDRKLVYWFSLKPIVKNNTHPFYFRYKGQVTSNLVVLYNY